MSMSLYEEALTASTPDPAGAVWVQWDDGHREQLDIARFTGGLDDADRALLQRLDGPTIDIGCGPARVVVAVHAGGTPALGVDVSPAAVRLARARGAPAIVADVLDLPATLGPFRHALLLDGNIGIGGDPARLLRCIRRVLTPDGQVHVELAPPGGRDGSWRARLERAGTTGAWFDWSRVTACSGALEAEAARVGLGIREEWQVGGRWFAVLCSTTERPTGIAP